MLTIAEINEIDRFFQLKHEWNRVLERSRDDNLYLTWEYLSTYWKHFGRQKKLRILCIEDKDEIIAIAPLRQSRYNFADSFSCDVIEPLGYEGAAYTGFLLAKRETECLKLFLKYLVEQGDWDFINLFDVPKTSAILDLLPEASEIIPTFELSPDAICPYVPIPNSMDIFMKGLNRKFRSNLLRRMRNLKKDYQKVELKSYNELGSVEEAMKIYHQLHQKRWKSKGMPGVFDIQKRRDFSIDMAKNFANNGWLALNFLTVNDKPIAVEYCHIYKQKMYGGLSGFDPSYSQYSPGHLVFLKVIQKCIQEKLREYDFLRGATPYKLEWSTNYRRNLNIRFVNKSFTSQLYHWGLGMVTRLKMKNFLQKFLYF